MKTMCEKEMAALVAREDEPDDKHDDPTPAA